MLIHIGNEHPNMQANKQSIIYMSNTQPMQQLKVIALRI